jgi:hypothetical protein
VWTGVGPDVVLEFLGRYRVDPEARSVSLPLIRAYIERLVAVGELTRWTVAVCGLQLRNNRLGTADWNLPTGPVNQVSRSRLGKTDSVGVIVDPEDERIGLQTEARGKDARQLRSPEEGLLLLYPISRYSGQASSAGGTRQPLFENANDSSARDLVGLAISFPEARQPQPVDAYLEGTVGWQPVQ